MQVNLQNIIFDRIFNEQPAVHKKYFSHLDISKEATVAKHGLKFMHAVDKIISLVDSGNDDELVATIHQVISHCLETKFKHKRMGPLNSTSQASKMIPSTQNKKNF